MKLYYLINCFRYEKPQAGRSREFYQFGVEMFGAESAYADATVISLADDVLKELGITAELNINSIGCPECRPLYRKALVEYFESKKEELCPTCKERLQTNPLRILDCKSPICKEIAAGAPLILDYLCDDCKEHFENLQKYLKLMKIDYEINPRIVRGLDYYTRTVFEFITTDIGAQGTVCGGGRYDGLIEQLGGKPTPALGFGMGLERLILTMQSQGCEFEKPDTCDLYFATMGEKASDKAVELTSLCRQAMFSAEYDVVGRGLKAQMKYADKIGAKYVVVLGDNEIESGVAKLKNMKSGEQTEIKLDDSFVDNFENVLMADAMAGDDFFSKL